MIDLKRLLVYIDAHINCSNRNCSVCKKFYKVEEDRCPVAMNTEAAEIAVFILAKYLKEIEEKHSSSEVSEEEFMRILMDA